MMAGKVTVIGSGTMGSGIAQAVLSAGYDVHMIAHSEKSIMAGKGMVLNGFEKAIAAGAMTKEREEELVRHLSISGGFDGAEGSVFVIEAVSEKLDAKRDVLGNVEKHIGKETVIATNTSSMPIDDLAESLEAPERFIGMHFFNPVPVMKVVEVIRGSRTSDDTAAKAGAFAASMGKTAVQVKDSPGFVANRLLMVLINEAARSLDEGIATKEGIDTVVRLGLRHPMGPIELADFIGLDVCKDIMDEIFGRTGSARFKPAQMIVDLVGKGELGRKSGKGFYDYRK